MNKYEKTSHKVLQYQMPVLQKLKINCRLSNDFKLPMLIETTLKCPIWRFLLDWGCDIFKSRKFCLLSCAHLIFLCRKRRGVNIVAQFILDQKKIKTKQYHTILTLKSESLYDRQPNLLESNFESLRIRFGDLIA